MLIALENIDAVIKTIRSSYDNAKINLMNEFKLTDIQAQAILDMRLARLQGLEKEKLDDEYNELLSKIKYYNEVLNDESMVLGIIKEELLVIKEKFGDERRTEITNVVDEIDIEDLIEEEENVITLTHFGYIKRMPTSTYTSQRRGGKGIKGLSTREEDFVEHIIVGSTHDTLLFFTTRGRMYRLKAYQLPEAGRQAKGSAVINLLPIEKDEKITAVIPIREFEEDKYLVMCTKKGIIKKTSLSDYNSIRKGGLIAISLDDDDELIKVERTDGSNEIIVATNKGMAIRFSEQNVRPMGRVTRGVKAITLRDDDYVIGMCIPSEGFELLAVTENGYGKRTSLSEYRVQTRGGIGIKTYKCSEVTGNVIGIYSVDDSEDIILITSEGIIIRISAADIRTIGRTTKGVRLMRLDEGVKVVSMGKTEHEEKEDEESENNETENGADSEAAESEE